MDTSYTPQQWVWSEADFDGMKWHDCRIHAVAFCPESYELVMDVDYILEWIQPDPPNANFNFWIAPATLIFENVYDLEMDSTNGDFQIAEILRSEPGKPLNGESINREVDWLWNISCHRGDITFRSVGYKLYLRTTPLCSNKIRIGLEQRGGYSFARGRSELPD